MTALRVGLTVLLVAFVTLLAGTYLHAHWVGAFAEGPQISSGWWSPRWLLATWGWEVIVAFAGVCALWPLVPHHYEFRSCLGFGVILAVARLLAVGGIGSITDVDLAMWKYGSCLMPLIGVTAGGIGANALSGHRRRLTTRSSGP
jgi:hypothetical protein